MIPITEPYHELLVPIKDPAKSFEINIAHLLKLFIQSFVNGQRVNFNKAALIIQGCASIYGKKVEYLYNLAIQLYNTLCKKNKDGDGKEPHTKKTREKKDGKYNDPFFPVDIKVGKHLSCLRKKNTTAKTANKKQTKKGQKRTFVPVNLLPFEGEEKGAVFYDTRGEAIGNKADYHLNKCKVSANGWLLLPTVNEDQIPRRGTPPDYSINEILPGAPCFSGSLPQCTPDEGIDACSEITSSQPNSTPGIPMSQETDEGLGSIPSTPFENPSQETPSCSQTDPLPPDPEPMDGIEFPAGEPEEEDSVDIEDREIIDFPEDIVENEDFANKSTRRQSKRLLDKKDVEEEVPAIKKAIQKKNTCHLPSKLKATAAQDKSKTEKQHLFPVDAFCARTFFSVDTKWWKNSHQPLETDGFSANSNMEKKFKDISNNMTATGKNKKGEAAEDENDEEEENLVGSLNDPDPDDMMAIDPLDDNDIVISNPEEIALPDSQPPSAEVTQTEVLPEPALEEGQPPEPVPVENEPPMPDNEDLRNMRELEKNATISSKVKEWQARVVPFLDELKTREEFDIHKYGSDILNSFGECSDGKQSRQTKTFRDFCKGLPKWLVHRYFMALLPLENIGNVTLEVETRPDGEEDILITLLSKTMHHKKLEEFDATSQRKSLEKSKKKK